MGSEVLRLGSLPHMTLVYRPKASLARTQAQTKEPAPIGAGGTLPNSQHTSRDPFLAVLGPGIWYPSRRIPASPESAKFRDHASSLKTYGMISKTSPRRRIIRFRSRVVQPKEFAVRRNRQCDDDVVADGLECGADIGPTARRHRTGGRGLKAELLCPSGPSDHNDLGRASDLQRRRPVQKDAAGRALRKTPPSAWPIVNGAFALGTDTAAVSVPITTPSR